MNEKNAYETFVVMNSDNDVITEEHETALEALAEVLEKYTIEEMRENGFTLNKVLADGKSWLECLEEIDY